MRGASPLWTVGVEAHEEGEGRKRHDLVDRFWTVFPTSQRLMVVMVMFALSRY
jgi:hypothetical protein